MGYVARTVTLELNLPWCSDEAAQDMGCAVSPRFHSTTATGPRGFVFTILNTNTV